MIEINLLPKELRKKTKAFTLDRNALYFVAGGAAILVIMIMITSFQTLKLKGLDKKIMEAQRKKEQLRESIQMVDAISELKNSIVRRMTAIEDLDKNRSTWIEVLQDLSDRVPEYVWLSSFKEVPKTQPQTAQASPTGSDVLQDTLKKAPIKQTSVSDMTIDGYSLSINNLAIFMINLMRSDYFKNIELKFVRADAVEDQKIFAFQLAGNLLYSSQAEKEAKLKQKMREPETGS
jgi:Tfp pilus assembly protein PilN